MPIIESDDAEGCVAMCNDYRLLVDLDTIASEFADLNIKIDFLEGAPNFAARYFDATLAVRCRDCFAVERTVRTALMDS